MALSQQTDGAQEERNERLPQERLNRLRRCIIDRRTIGDLLFRSISETPGIIITPKKNDPSSSSDLVADDSTEKIQTYSSVAGEYLPDQILFMTFSKFFDFAMFGPTGYYMMGNVKFASDENNIGHFSTWATDGNRLADTLAKILFPKLKKQDELIIAEIGPGDGSLCKKIMKSLADLLAAANLQAHKKIRYIMVDRSEALHKTQEEMAAQFQGVQTESDGEKNLNATFIAEARTGDARAFTLDTKADVIISNELIDEFRHDQVKRINDALYTSAVIPVINIENVRENIEGDTLLDDEDEKTILAYKLFLRSYYPVSPHWIDNGRNNMDLDNKDFLPVPPNLFKKLVHKCTEKNLPVNMFDYHLWWIPVPWVPELKQFIEKYPEVLLGSEDDGDVKIIPTDDYIQYCTSVGNSLKSDGTALNIDYGFYTVDLHDQPRYYHAGRSKRNQSFWKEIQQYSLGRYDMTCDVDFTLLQLMMEKFLVPTCGDYWCGSLYLTQDEFEQIMLGKDTSLSQSKGSQKDPFKVLISGNLSDLPEEILSDPRYALFKKLQLKTAFAPYGLGLPSENTQAEQEDNTGVLPSIS